MGLDFCFAFFVCFLHSAVEEPSGEEAAHRAFEKSSHLQMSEGIHVR